MNFLLGTNRRHAWRRILVPLCWYSLISSVGGCQPAMQADAPPWDRPCGFESIQIRRCGDTYVFFGPTADVLRINTHPIWRFPSCNKSTNDCSAQKYQDFAVSIVTPGRAGQPDYDEIAESMTTIAAAWHTRTPVYVRYHADGNFRPVSFAQCGAVFPERSAELYQIVLLRGIGSEYFPENDPLVMALRAAGLEEVTRTKQEP